MKSWTRYVSFSDVVILKQSPNDCDDGERSEFECWLDEPNPLAAFDNYQFDVVGWAAHRFEDAGVEFGKSAEWYSDAIVAWAPMPDLSSAISTTDYPAAPGTPRDFGRNLCKAVVSGKTDAAGEIKREKSQITARMPLAGPAQLGWRNEITKASRQSGRDRNPAQKTTERIAMTALQDRYEAEAIRILDKLADDMTVVAVRMKSLLAHDPAAAAHAHELTGASETVRQWAARLKS